MQHSADSHLKKIGLYLSLKALPVSELLAARVGVPLPLETCW